MILVSIVTPVCNASLKIDENAVRCRIAIAYRDRHGMALAVMRLSSRDTGVPYEFVYLDRCRFLDWNDDRVHQTPACIPEKYGISAKMNRS
jgi:hypothetical protein